MPKTTPLSADHVTVIGAGIVGTCTALSLRLAGLPVTLVDRAPPGSGASSGNAGMLGTASCVPIALPGVLKKIPKMMRGVDAAIGLKVAELPRVLPWMIRFAASAMPGRIDAISDALHSLQRELMPAYETLLDASGAKELVVASGKLHVCESEETFATLAFPMELQRRHGISFQVLQAEEVRQLAPALARTVTRGVYYPDVQYCVNPQAMIERFAEAFVRAGGVIVREDIQDMDIGVDGPTGLVGRGGTLPVRRMVVAAGLWSTPLAAKLGADVPMISHRGYHAMLKQPAEPLRLPVKSEDRKIVLTPMQHGLRITGIAEVAPAALPPAPKHHASIIGSATKVVPALDGSSESTWMGNRPCTPDSLPVIGQSPRYASSYLAFGHGHMGLGLGAITGRLVAELVTQGKASVDLTPFRAERF